MPLELNSVVELEIIKVSGYACWGKTQEKSGFIHCTEWSWEAPIPVDSIPQVGQKILAKIIHIN